MTPAQSRMARAALKWSATDLAKRSGVGYATVARFETDTPVQEATIAALRTALEAAGVEFIPAGGASGGGGPGVRLRQA